MIVSEAIEMLEQCGLNIEQPKHDEVLNIVVEAVGKQIQKKPSDITTEYDGEYGRCPFCGRVVTDYGNFHRCHFCGQALDWSDTE